MADDALTKALEKETGAITAMQNGDPGPMINFWADSDDITLFGRWDPSRYLRQMSGQHAHRYVKIACH